MLAADRARTLRASRELLSMTAVLTPAGPLRSAGLRLGITVGRRQARRAVDRSLVKRIVREAARQVAAGLQRRCEQAGIAVDVVIRLKTEGRTGTTVAALTPWRRQLRAEADALLADLQRRLPAASGEERVDV